ncbi:hypothetical protein [Stenotrophomonas phage SOVA965]
MGVANIKAEFHERKVREMLAAGYSVSKIAKVIEKSYEHTKRLVERAKGEEGR